MSSSYNAVRLRKRATLPHTSNTSTEGTLWLNSTNNLLYLDGNPLIGATGGSAPAGATGLNNFQGWTINDQTADYPSSKALFFDPASLELGVTGPSNILCLATNQTKDFTWTGSQTHEFTSTDGKSVYNYTGDSGFFNDRVGIRFINDGYIRMENEGPENQISLINMGNVTASNGSIVTFSASYQGEAGQQSNVFSLAGGNGEGGYHQVIIGDNLRSKNHVFFDNNEVTIHKNNVPILKIDLQNNSLKIVDSNNDQIANLQLGFDGTLTIGAIGSSTEPVDRPCSLTFNQNSGWFRLYNGGAPTFQVNAKTGYLETGIGQNNTMIFNSTNATGDIFTVTNNTISRVAKITAETVNSINEVAFHVNAFLGQKVFIEENGLIQGGQNLFDWIKDQFGL